jgi:hypothetical protein
MLQKILSRLREPSTLAGLSVLAVLFGVDAVKADLVTQAVGGVLAVAAAVVPESRGGE